MNTAFQSIAALGLALAVGAAGAQEPRRGGTFSYIAPHGDSVSTLDPTRSTRTQDFMISFGLHCMLYRWDAAQKKPVPDLAQSVEKLPGDKPKYLIKLRPNAKFHNGRAVTVDDVIYSYNRTMEPGKGYSGVRYINSIAGADEVAAGRSKSLSGLRKINDTTLELTMADAIDPGYLLFWPATAILPKEELDKRGDRFGAQPVGCGPFELQELVRGSHVTLKRFDGYYMPGRPYLDKVVYNIMGEAAPRDLAFRAGQLDATTVIAAQITAYRSDPALKNNLLEVVADYTRHMGFNPDFKPFQDKRVRQAINYAVDRKLIIKKLLRDQAMLATGWLPSTSEAYDPALPPYPYDPAKAKALMKEAGYEKGFDLEVTTNNNSAYGIAVAEAITPYLKAIGITVKPKVVENAIAVETMFQNGKYEAYMWSYSSGPDPYVASKRFTSDTSRSAGNSILYKNPQYDAAVAAAGQSKTGAERIQRLRTANKIMVEDAPMWFFNYDKAVMAYKPWVHGLQPNSVHITYQYPDLIWVDAKSPRANAK